MTLPKNLKEKRDNSYDKHIENKECTCDENDYGCAYRDESFDFKSGFDSACDLLIPEIEKLQDALEYIASDYPKSYIHDSDIERAKKALQYWQQFLGEKSEGGDE